MKNEEAINEKDGLLEEIIKLHPSDIADIFKKN